jgi:hypothetical protein
MGAPVLLASTVAVTLPSEGAAQYAFALNVIPASTSKKNKYQYLRISASLIEMGIKGLGRRYSRPWANSRQPCAPIIAPAACAELAAAF